MTDYQDLQVVRLLNRSNASVYLSYCKTTEKHYAMKVFPNECSSISQHYYIEARFSWLSHPNVISIKDVQPEARNIPDHQESVSYILMELAPFGDFGKLLQKCALYKDEKLVRTYFRQILDGLQYLHDNGLAHLDLKPQNLLLCENYVLKITDFDCSHSEEDAFVSVGGTRGYRAPEIASDECVNPKAADIYSLGVILFTMMTGYLPYAENKEYHGTNLWDLLQNEDPRFWQLHKRHSGTEEFQELFTRMMKKNPAERPTVDQIKKSRFCTGPVYDNKELANVVLKLKAKSVQMPLM